MILWLGTGLAPAFDTSTILDAKLHAGRGGFPCVLRGAVTMSLTFEEFYLQDATSGVRVSSATYQLNEGDRLEVEGWMYLDDAGEFQVRAAKIWHLGNGPPVLPRLTTLSDAYSGVFQGQLLAVRGAVLNVDFGNRFDTISIQHGRTSVRVFSPATHRGISVFERIYPGMQVAVTGVSVPQTADPEFDGYQVRLRTSGDLSIRPASGREGSPGRGLTGGVAGLLCVGAAFWIWNSRQRRVPGASQVQ
jgi:hypothetical protein